MHKIRIDISYDGTDFFGWQRQNQGQATVQEELEKALRRLFEEDITVVGSGRTDARVHAIRQTAHFSTKRDPAKYNVVRALNSMLPTSIVIREAWLVPGDFHALFSAEQKTYKYLIHNFPQATALRRNFVYWVQKPLNLSVLNSFCPIIEKKQDFKSFQTSGTEVETTVRTVFKAHWRQIEPHLLEFRITGDGFLKQMVRNIVGTMLYLERNGGSPQDLAEILRAEDRQSAKDTAPAQGLYLCGVKYPRDLDNKCRKI